MDKTIPLPLSRLVTAALWLGLAALALILAAAQTALSGMQGLIGLLTLFIGAIVATFSQRFMRGDAQRERFFGLLGLLVAAVLVLTLAGNVVVFALGWVASGLLLARLIGHVRGWDEAEAAAARTRHAFLIGDSAVLAGLAILALGTGSTSLATILSSVGILPQPLLVVAALLLLTGAAARCALPPFSGWLMTSMTAPTPVSALMHAGLVNAGGFLLLRFAPLFEAAPAARLAAIAVGLLAALWGLGIMAVRSDVKRALAGSTVSQMGFMIMSCGLGAYAAALWHIVAHGLFKAWLFLGAGSAVGMRGTAPRAALGAGTVALIGAGALVVGAALAFGSAGIGGELVPLVLAGATAAMMLAAVPATRVSLASRVTLIVAVAALIAVNLLGFAFAGSLVGFEGPAVLSPAATLALLLPFLGLWLWQARLGDGARPINPALYVRLLNAGDATRAPSARQSDFQQGAVK